MAEPIEVPVLMSIEGRANMISDECGRAEHAGSPDKRREHVKAHALAHMRAMLEQTKTGSVHAL